MTAMRRQIIAGNWKAHLTLREAEVLVKQLKASCDATPVDVIVCPSFAALTTVNTLLQGSSIALGAQDVFWGSQGAFTGEVTTFMLRDVGCRYVIVGHSERRTHFGETDEMVYRKLRAALAQKLTPIVCIGETLSERDAGQTFDVLERQLDGALKECPADVCRGIVLAYEPVWAIGTGRNATPEQAQEAQAFIRTWISKRCGVDLGESIRIQYGGSVNPGNAASILAQPDVDGALVGGASLKAESFAAIVKAAAESKVVRS